MADKKPISKQVVKNASELTTNEKAAKASTTPKKTLDQETENSSLAEKFGDAVKPAAPDKDDDGQFKHTGLVWWVGLDNDQTHDLEGVLATGGSALASLAGPLWPAVGAALLAAIGYIELVNRLGGSYGVDITGVAGTEGVVVTPRVGGFYGELIQAARLAVSGRTIIDFLVIASGDIPALGATLNIPVVASVLTAIESGTPFGWALAGALGLAVDLIGKDPEPDPNQHGHIWANRDEAQDWESFIMASVGTDNKVSLLSWQGLFSAQNGGGGDVYANRPQVGDWETWTLIDNGDGTVSYKSFDGHYLSAEQGGGAACYANRSAIGTWEKFYLVNLPSGKIALKAHDKGKFVSVQQ